MAHEHDGPVELVDDRSEIGGIVCDPSKGHRGRENVVVLSVEVVEDAAPARSVSERAVDQKDCRIGHEASFRLFEPARAHWRRRRGIAPVVCTGQVPVYPTGASPWGDAPAPPDPWAQCRLNPLEDQWSFFARRCVPSTTRATR